MRNRILVCFLVVVCVVSLILLMVGGERNHLQAAENPLPLSPLAGQWYPADREELSSQIAGYIAAATGEVHPNLQALIMPHAGYQYSGQTAAYGIRQLQDKKFSRVVVMGPSHRVPLSNMAAISSGTGTRTPLGIVPFDMEFIQKLRGYPLVGMLPPAGEMEHSVGIQVPLLQQVLGPFQFVPMVLGQMDEKTTKRLAEILCGLIDEKTLVIASSDFTHYGPNYDYIPFKDKVQENLKALDMGAYVEIEKKDPAGFRAYCEKTGATICGEVPISVLLAMLPAESQAHLLHYDTSGKSTGDEVNSVSYLAVAFSGQWKKGEAVIEETQAGELTEDQKKGLLSLARKTLEYAFEKRKAPTAADLSYTPLPETEKISGAFVTLKEKGELRGCIGDIFPERPLYEAVIGNAISAAFQDPRFNPLAREELAKVSIEITVLTSPQPVKGYEDIVLGKHGILLNKNGHRAVFLPQVATEQGWDIAQTLTHLSQKAGLSSDDWKSGASFEVFEGIVFHEGSE
jgi:MEMO1 family protein